MAVPNLTPQEQAIRAQILQRWGGSGAWDNDSVDLAGDLARRMVASGIADLDKLQFTPTTRRELVRAEHYDNDAEYLPAQFADYDNAFDLTYDGKVVGSKGFIGNINRDGSLGDGDVFSSNTYHPNLLAWSSRGKGAREYRVEFDAQGNPVVNPVFQSSSFWNSDLGGLVKAAATAVAMYYGLGALGAAAGSGAGAAGAGAAAGGAAGSGAAGMTAAEQVAMMAANGMTDARIGISNGLLTPVWTADTGLKGLVLAAWCWRLHHCLDLAGFGRAGHRRFASGSLDFDTRVDPGSARGLPASTPGAAQRHLRLGCRQAAPAPVDVSDVRGGRCGSACEFLPRLARPAPGRRLRLQPQVGEDRLDHRPLEDGRNDLQLPGALEHRLGALGGAMTGWNLYNQWNKQNGGT